MPGRLGRRSPLYHPFFLILIALLLVIATVFLVLPLPSRLRIATGVVDGREYVAGCRIVERKAQGGDEESARPAGYHFVRRLDGPIGDRLAGAGRAITAAGDDVAVVFDDAIVRYRVTGFDAAGDPVVEERETLPFKESLEALAAAWTDDGPVVVGRGLASHDLHVASLDFGSWISRRVAELDEEDVVSAAAVAGNAKETNVFWAVRSEGGDTIRGARVAGHRVDESFLTLSAAGTVVDLAATATENGVVLGSLETEANGRARTWDVIHVDGALSARERRKWVLEGRTWAALVLHGDAGYAASRTSLVRLLPNGHVERTGPGFTQVDILRQRVLPTVYILALAALVWGIVEAFRRPVLSEPILRHRPAPFVRRMIAFFIDSSLSFAVSAGAAWAMGRWDLVESWIGVMGSGTANTADSTLPHGEDAWPFYVLAYVVGTVPFAMMEASRGYTVGKAVVRLRVVNEQGTDLIPFWRALSRRVFLYADLALFTVIFAFLNVRHQRLGDIVSRTMVIDQNPPPPPPEATPGNEG